MKILYIDLFSQYGHTSLNRIYIKKICELGYQVDFIVRKGYVEELGIFNENIVWPIPEMYFDPNAGKILDRYRQWQMLFYIKRNFDLKQYKYVFFSFFEEISFYLSGIKGNVILLNHANVAGLDNLIKRYFLKKLNNRATFMVFHKSIKDRFNKFGIMNILVEPLGLFAPFKGIPLSTQIEILSGMDERLVSKGFRYKIFCPTGSKYNDQFISDLINDTFFLNFLTDHQILLIIKDNNITSNHRNIIILNFFISDHQYQSVFKECDCLLIAYPSSFRYKVSAALFECFSNEKPCILSGIESFIAFSKHFNYNPFYETKQQLAQRIIFLMENMSIETGGHYRYLDKLNPKFDFLLN